MEMIVLIFCLFICLYQIPFNSNGQAKTGVGIEKTEKPEPDGWYAGDMHVHLDCNGPELYSENELPRLMEPNDLTVISVLADVGTGTLKDSKRDLPKVNGTNTRQSRPDRIIHWDTEWLWWDAEKVQTLALGGHLALTGLKMVKRWRNGLFPLGVYRTGTIHLRSGIILYLNPGVTIQGIERMEDYQDIFDLD